LLGLLSNFSEDLGTMEGVPITGLEELERHIQHLVEAPGTPLDAHLFDEVELQLTGEFTRS
jgi:hypothetical protein